MDSLTQVLLGAAAAGAASGRFCTPRVLLAGGILGALPDLDVLIQHANDVADVVEHRGFTHSFLVLLPCSWLAAVLYRKCWPDTRWSVRRLWGCIGAALITHPMLDSFTTYGTQVIWPFSYYLSLSSIFIIDPIYTLVLACALVFALSNRKHMARACGYGLLISSLYLGVGLVAKQVIAARVHSQLQSLGLMHAPVHIAPTPFNILLWRVLVLDGDRYMEGLSSLLDQDTQIAWFIRARGHWPMAQHPESYQSLQAFSHDFLKYNLADEQLQVSDLRMGMGNYLVFNFLYAKRDATGNWQLQEPELLSAWESYQGRRAALGAVFKRIGGDRAADQLLLGQEGPVSP